MSKSLVDRFKWSVIGHSTVINFLQNSLVNRQIAQAYLFVGQNHIGKSAVAKNFVDSLVCQNTDKDVLTIPCGQCESCQQALKGVHPDIYWLGLETNDKTGKLKKNISVEQIRNLQGKLGLRSFLNTYKTVVIENAERLSIEGANSLLKTLEEPAARTVLILLATNTSSLPSTIVSRCQVLRFLPVATATIQQALRHQGVEDKKAKALAAISFGLPGIGLSLAENPDDYLSLKADGTNFLTLLRSNLHSRLKLIDDIFNFYSPEQVRHVLLNWKRVLRDVFLINNECELLIGNLALYADLKKTAAERPTTKIIDDLKQIDASVGYLEQNVSPKLVIENLVLNF